MSEGLRKKRTELAQRRAALARERRALEACVKALLVVVGGMALGAVLALLSGCLWGGLAAVAGSAQQAAHSCACKAGGTSQMRRCDCDGSPNPSGACFCCDDCGKVCGLKADEAAKPPVPVPVPCNDHCTQKRSCAAGQCCKRCGHACLDL